MKRIGIVTFFQSYNYGVWFQAYATQAFLRGRGYDCLLYTSAIKLWESVFAYDLKYVSNITWIGDLKIILSTISKVFKRSDVVVPTGEGGSGRLDVERRNRQNNVRCV